MNLITSRPMLKSDFCYHLPQRLIAQHPLPDRTASRLLCLDGPSGMLEDRKFIDLIDLVQTGDLLVFNDTKVIPARLFGQKATGGKVELLIERILDANNAVTHIRASKSPRLNSSIELEAGYQCKVIARQESLYIIRFDGEQTVQTILNSIGHVPLPPYISRPDNIDDLQRYQTVFADKTGAVAAPTAGLHFDAEFIDDLCQRGVDTAYLTLHVGSGTFQPVRVDDLKQHEMHSEFFQVDDPTVTKVNQTKANGGRVIAVGTTSVRALETASIDGELKPYCGETSLFIVPGFQFNCVDAMVTNFHLPESTLLALVCAFSGYQSTMTAYRHAVEKEYRFFSYGDAMYLTRAG